MTTIDKIRAEIERMHQQSVIAAVGNETDWLRSRIGTLVDVMDFLDTLEEPEQPTMGYDEAYLNEKIAKVSKSWEGVDVDKYMDEVRGREPVTDCHDLEEAAENSWAVYEYRESPKGLYYTCYVDGFKAGAEWQKKQIPMPEDTVLFQKGVEEGKRLLMEGAVEGTVIELGETYKDLSLSVNAKELNQVLQPLGVGDGNKVKIIIVKEEEQ